MSSDNLSDLRMLSRGKVESFNTSIIPRPPFKWKSRLLVPGLVFGGLMSLFFGAAYESLIPATQVRAAPVVLKTFSDQIRGAVTVQAAGWVEADPYKSYVSALAEGVVREVLVLEGEHVEKDQVVVRLVEDDARLALQESEAKVSQLEAAVGSARAELKAARVAWENPVDRRHAVKVAQAGLDETKRSLEQISAEITMEQARLKHAQSEYDRNMPLHRSSAIPESELIRVLTEFEAQRAKLESVKSKKLLTLAKIAKCEADLSAAREHMRLRTEEKRRLERGETDLREAEASLQRARADRDKARLRLERMQVRSPISGVVMRRLAVPGTKLVLSSDDPHSAHVLTLYQPKRLQARVDVPLADAAKIGVGQAAEIVVEVLPDRVFSGRVSRVLHEANIQKNTLEVKVAIVSPSPELRPEMLARVRFLAQAERERNDSTHALFAPAKAFRSKDGSSKTWIVQDFDGTYGIANERIVRLGRTKINGWIHVVDGLQPGDLVVAHASGHMDTGTRIRVFEDPASGE